MKILRLTAENVKKLKVADITPTGHMVQVTGKNGSGKTSVLDSIWWALAGAKGIQSVPINTDAQKGRIRLVLGSSAEVRDFVVTRIFRKSGTTSLTIYDANGKPAETPDEQLPVVKFTPQDVLDALFGQLSFDPLAFSRMAPRAQFDELRSVSKLSVDIDALDAASKVDFAKRTDINRAAKAKRAQADGIITPAGTPAEPIDETELLNKIQAAGEHNAGIETRKARREQAQRDATDKKAEGVRLRNRSAQVREQTAQRVADLQAQIARLQKDGEATAIEVDEQASAALNLAGEIEKKIDEAPALPTPISVAELRASLDAAKATNAHVSRRKQRDQIAAEAKALESQAQELTDRMAGREKSKLAAITAAEMPVDGLGFGEGLVTYAGLPFEQASDAEQLRVSVSIAMASNPKLRVLRIKDGSLLDDDSLKLIADMAAEKDYQVWIERVDASGKIGIVMEDGEVKADNQMEPAEAPEASV